MQAGTRIREYEMIRLLGRGGMAEVWLASSPKMKGQYAVKFILDQFANNFDIQTRFVEEALKQSGLHHSNIVDVKTVFEDKGRDYIIMEYVESGLDKRLHELYGKPLPLPEAVNITLQLLDALAYTHTLPGGPLIHRDIKPSNVLLKADGSIRLTDFGIALAANEARKTMTGQALGTAFYMSPEQIRTPGAVDPRTDIYSVGCVLYELLTGRPPFGKDGDTDYTIQHEHVNRMPDPLRRSNATIPEQFEWIVLKALAKEPRSRFQSCREMASALMTVYRDSGLPMDLLTSYHGGLTTTHLVTNHDTPPPHGGRIVSPLDQRPTGGTIVEQPRKPRTGETIVEATRPSTPLPPTPLPSVSVSPKPGFGKVMVVGVSALVVGVAAIAGSLYNHKPITATPTISPSGGSFSAGHAVVLSDKTPEAAIFYTTDGKTPGVADHLYTGPIQILGPTTIHAVALAPGYQTSPMAEASFIQPISVVVDPPPPEPAGQLPRSMVVPKKQQGFSDPPVGPKRMTADEAAERCRDNPNDSTACTTAGFDRGNRPKPQQ